MPRPTLPLPWSPLVAALALPLIPACAAPGTGDAGADPGLVDTDGDGLADSYEDEVGTDPDAGDTDEDGWDDGIEVHGFSDPIAPEDHPYLGGWERSPIPEELSEAETGNEVGDIAPDFSLVDQFGEEVRLWSFYGKVIVVENGAFW